MNEEGSLSIERKVMPYDPDLLQLIEAASAEQIDVVSGHSLIIHRQKEHLGHDRCTGVLWPENSNAFFFGTFRVCILHCGLIQLK